MTTYNIGLLIIPNEYIIGWASIDTNNGVLHGFFIGSWGLGVLVEY